MAEVMLVNPRRRKAATRKRRSTARKTPARKTTARKRSTYRRNPVSANPRRRRRSYRRNPAGRFSLKGFTKDTLMPSAVGAVGALGVDMLMGVVPLPANLKTGPIKPLVKGVGAVAIGMAASMLASRKVAEQITAGGLTVVLYDTAKTYLMTQFPTLPLAGMDEYPTISYLNPSPVLDDDSMGAYIGQEQDLGGSFDESLGGEFDESLGAYVEDDSLAY